MLLPPKPMKLYSANTDQCGANIHSPPSPSVQPLLLVELWSICVPGRDRIIGRDSETYVTEMETYVNDCHCNSDVIGL